MCEIDWAALGTWAAVMVALWIALRDSLQAKERKRLQEKVLATLLLPDLIMARAMLLELRQRYLQIEEGADWADAVLANHEATRADFRQLVDTIQLRAGDSIVQALPSVSPDLSEPLATTITKLRLVREFGVAECDRNEPNFMRFMPQFRQLVRDASDAVASALTACEARAGR